MTISLKHAKESTIADGTNEDLIRPSDWNAEHVLLQATARILGRITAEAGATEELTKAQVLSFLNAEDGATADLTGAEILALLLDVDGAGTGLDADLLDGNEASAFQAASSNLDDWANEAVAGYYTAAAVDAILTAYYTAAQVDFIFSSYYTSAQVDALFGDYYTSVQIDAAFQPLDDDLTALAALTTTAAGRTILEVADPGADRIFFWDDSESTFAPLTLGGGLSISGTQLRKEESFVIACSDETSDLETGTAKVTFRMPYAFEVTAVRASVTTAPTGQAIQVDINEGGASILTTEITIDAGDTTSEDATTPPAINDGTIADDAEITIDLDQIGSGTAGAGLKVVLIGYRP